MSARREGRKEGTRQTDTAEGRGSGEWLGGGRSCSMCWESERREGGSEEERRRVCPSLLISPINQVQWDVHGAIAGSGTVSFFVFL